MYKHHNLGIFFLEEYFTWILKQILRQFSWVFFSEFSHSISCGIFQNNTWIWSEIPRDWINSDNLPLFLREICSSTWISRKCIWFKKIKFLRSNSFSWDKNNLHRSRKYWIYDKPIFSWFSVNSFSVFVNFYA